MTALSPTSKPLTFALTARLFAAPILARTSNETGPTDAPAIENAVAIAFEAQKGAIGEAKLDQFEGKPAYDIEVVNAVGDEIEGKIDAGTGDILNNWIDENRTDDPS